MSNNNGSVEQIDMRRIISILMDRIVSIVVVTLICGLIAFILSNYFIAPKYESEISMIVDNRKSTTIIEDSLESKTLSSDILASQQLVPTYIEMMESDNVLEEVATKIEKETGEKYSVKMLKSLITTEAVPDTEILKVYVKMTDAAMAREIAETIAEIAPEKIQHFIERSDVKIIDHAKISTSPVYPNVRDFTLWGCLIGFLLSISFILLREMFDVRVKTADDLVSIFKYPVLGTIPEIFVDYEETTYAYEADTTEENV